MKTLVAYFSCSGVTKGVAELIAKSVDADLHEIEPLEAYSDADLDWMDANSRSSLESADEYSRPEIKRFIKNMGDYDMVFVGFPIWWYKAPQIILTFLESYDFSNKTIIPFATSGSSVYGTTNEFLKKSIRGNTSIKDGKLCSFIDDKEIVDWVKEMVK